MLAKAVEGAAEERSRLGLPPVATLYSLETYRQLDELSHRNRDPVLARRLHDACRSYRLEPERALETARAELARELIARQELLLAEARYRHTLEGRENKPAESDRIAPARGSERAGVKQMEAEYRASREYWQARQSILADSLRAAGARREEIVSKLTPEEQRGLIETVGLMPRGKDRKEFERVIEAIERAQSGGPQPTTRPQSLPPRERETNRQPPAREIAPAVERPPAEQIRAGHLRDARQSDSAPQRRPGEVTHDEKETPKVRAVLAGANDLLEKQILQRVKEESGLDFVRKAGDRLEMLIFDLRGAVLSHFVEHRTSLEALGLNGQSLDEKLNLFVTEAGKGNLIQPFGRGESVKEVQADEKKRQAQSQLSLNHNPSHVRDLADFIRREQPVRENIGQPKVGPHSDMAPSRLHALTLLAGLHLQAAEAIAERYKFDSLFETMLIPNQFGEPEPWSLAQGKYLTATNFRNFPAGERERVTKAVADTEKLVEEKRQIYEDRMAAARVEFEALKKELGDALSAGPAHSQSLPEPSFTPEETREAEKLIFLTRDTHALETLSRGEAGRDLRSAAERGEARATLALLDWGEHHERSRGPDRKIEESIKHLPAEHPLRAELSAYLQFHQAEGARSEQFLTAAKKISDHLQINCEVQLGERVPAVFRADEQKTVEKKLPALEQRTREQLLKELNGTALIRSDVGRTESAKFLTRGPSAYDKYNHLDVARVFEQARTRSR